MGKFDPVPLDSEQVKYRRYVDEISMEEAKSALRKEALRDALGRLRGWGSLEDKVEFLLDRLEESAR